MNFPTRKILHYNVIIYVVLLIQITIIHAQSPALEDYRWTTIRSSGDPTARHECAMAEYKGKFYLIGGRGINPVDVFDPQKNSWQAKTKTLFEMHHFQAVVYEDAIYIIGAMTGGYPKETPLENIWIYYPEQDKWQKGPEIPQERRRGSAGAAIYKDKLYIVCGIEYGHTSGTNNYFDSYDLKTGTWQILTKAPHIRDHFSVVVVEDKLYCIGGRNSSFHLPKRFEAFFEATIPYVDVYDFTESRWYTLKELLPFPTAAGSLVNMGDRIIYAGGEGEFLQAYNQTQRLDIESGKWSQLAPLNTGRHGGGAVLYNDQIYFAAGSPNKGGGNLNSIEAFSAQHTWKSLFNGKNLDGWSVKSVTKDSAKKFWSVRDGVIECNSMGSTDHNYIWLMTDQEYENFELRLKFQSSSETKGNSGIQVRSRYDSLAEMTMNGEKVLGWLDGPQMDIDPNNPWRNGYLYDETRGNQRFINPSLDDWQIDSTRHAPRRWIYYLESEGPRWNDVKIICDGTHIKTIINNIVISDYEGKGILDDSIHARYRTDKKGHIALQLHMKSENLICFKDVEIREF